MRVRVTKSEVGAPEASAPAFAPLPGYPGMSERPREIVWPRTLSKATKVLAR